MDGGEREREKKREKMNKMMFLCSPGASSYAPKEEEDSAGREGGPEAETGAVLGSPPDAGLPRARALEPVAHVTRVPHGMAERVTGHRDGDGEPGQRRALNGRRLRSLGCLLTAGDRPMTLENHLSGLLAGLRRKQGSPRGHHSHWDWGGLEQGERTQICPRHMLKAVRWNRP